MRSQSFDLLESPLEGTALIEASAGTGKTYAIAGLVLRLLLEKRLSVDRILVVTFTVAATEELRDRVRRRLRAALDAFESDRTGGDDLLRALAGRCDPVEAAARLAGALREFDQAPIFTIHGFCQRVLAEHAFESGLLFDAELLADPEPLFREVADDYWRKRFSAGPPLLARFASARGFSPDRLLALLRSHSRHPFLEILPAATPEDAEARLQSLLEVFEGVRAAWPGARAEVEALLRAHKGLSRSRENFGQAPLADCLRDLAACLGGDGPPGALAALRKVASRSFLREGVMTRGNPPPRHSFFDLCQTLAEAEDSLFLALQASFLAEARVELARRKRERRVQGFDDLLLNLHGALRSEGGPALARSLRARYGAALIDEFQDTDPLQYEIFEEVFGRSAEEPSVLYLIGDPKQAIYGFRGADVFAYLEASRSIETRYTLGKNWRSEPGLLQAAGALFAGAERPFVFPEIGFPRVEAAEAPGRPTLAGEPGAAPLRIWFAGRSEDNSHRGRIPKSWAERELPRAVAAEVSTLLGGGTRYGGRPLEPGDVAVLVRKNREARRVQESLRALGIPSVLYSTESLFVSREAEEVERLLLGLAEPGSERHVRAALATDLLGADGEELLRLAGAEAEWEAVLARFRDLHDLWTRRGFLPMFRRLLSDFGVRERLVRFADGERRLTNALHLGEVLHGAALDEKLGMAGLARWLGRKRSEREGGEEHELRLESDEKAVKLVTVHRSKGLEYPVVLCPFSWEGSELRGDEPGLKVHPEGGGSRFVLDLGSPLRAEHELRAAVESLAENVRLLYVALTRARSLCYLVWGAFNGSETSALAYLLHAGAGELDRGGLAGLGRRVKALSDEDLRQALGPLTEKGAAVEDLPEGPGAPWTRPEEMGEELRARAYPGSISWDFRTASFTSFTSGAPHAEELPDRDALSGGAEPDPGELSGFFAFPAGAAAGTCLHEILERADLAEEGGPPTAELVAGSLRAHGFDPSWQEAVAEMLAKVRAAPLDPGRPDLALARVPRCDRLHEVEFTLPLRPGAAALTPRALGRAFSEAGGAELASALGPGALERLGRLEFSPVRGHLRGFMDLIFRFEDRFYLVDWKSNRLGRTPEDYGAEALRSVMARDHYGLQYHLYALALHRHLRARLRGYDWDRHFGGVCYLFLRGVDPERPGRGIFWDRPPRSRIEGLARALLGPAGVEG